MAKTAKERQAAYRKRRPHSGRDGNGERRLNTWIGTGAAWALDRISRRYGVTKREILDRLIVAEDERILSGIELGSPEWDNYFGKPIVTR
ncbi:MAG: hypothetical protein WAW36_04200 [Methylovulum miyakonense]|uniref:hypothetical protein n=1 Tax=Methylovulum miyakonense TaxID=645578 RepID=UPI003BB5B6E0